MAASPVVTEATLHGLNEHLVISVGEWQRRKESSEFIVFQVRTEARDDVPVQGFVTGPYAVWRRFSDFETLWRFLNDKCPHCVIPPLPEKKINFKFSKMSVDKFDPDFIAKRKAALHAFVLRLAAHPVISAEPVLHAFLTDEDNWKDELKFVIDGEAHFWTPSLMDEKMKQLTTQWKLKNQDRRFLDIRNYADALQENLTNILTTHAKIAKRIQALHQNYNNFGVALNEWSNTESANFGAVIFKVGQQFDGMVELASEVLPREESAVVEPLKEYALFADALRDVVQRQEHLLCDFERSVAAVESKEKEIESVNKPEGVRGFFSSMISTTEEEKQAKLSLLQSQLEEMRSTAEKAADKCSHLTNDALADVQRFHDEKVKELKAIFLHYARLQKALAERNIECWQEIKSVASA